MEVWLVKTLGDGSSLAEKVFGDASSVNSEDFAPQDQQKYDLVFFNN